MLIIRSVNVFPSQIESVLLEIPEATSHYLIIVDRKGNMDTIEVQVEINNNYISDELSVLDEIKKKIKSKLDSFLRINTKVTLVEHRTVERSQGKSVRVIDRRKL